MNSFLFVFLFCSCAFGSLMTRANQDCLFEKYFGGVFAFFDILADKKIITAAASEDLRVKAQRAKSDTGKLSQVIGTACKIVERCSGASMRLLQSVVSSLQHKYNLHTQLVVGMGKGQIDGVEPKEFGGMEQARLPAPNDPFSKAIESLVSVTLTQIETLQSVTDEPSARQLLSRNMTYEELGNATAPVYTTLAELGNATAPVFEFLYAAHQVLESSSSAYDPDVINCVELFKYAMLRLFSSSRYISYGRQTPVSLFKQPQINTFSLGESEIQVEYSYTVDMRLGAYFMRSASHELVIPKAVIDIFPIPTHGNMSFLNVIEQFEDALDDLYMLVMRKDREHISIGLQHMVAEMERHAVNCMINASVNDRIFMMHFLKLAKVIVESMFAHSKHELGVNVVYKEYFVNNDPSISLLHEIKKLLITKALRDGPCDGKFDEIYTRKYEEVLCVVKLISIFKPAMADLLPHKFIEDLAPF